MKLPRMKFATLTAPVTFIVFAASGCTCGENSDKEAEAAAAAFGQALTEALDEGEKAKEPSEETKESSSLEGVSDEKIAELSLDFMDELAEVAVANKTDCDKIAAGWNELFKQKAELIDKVSELDKRQTPEQKEAFSAKHKDRSEAWMKQMEPIITACAENENMRQAMSNLKL